MADSSPETASRPEGDVCVIGLGYVGLPLALAYARAGYRVLGIERNPVRVAAVNEARSYIEEAPSEALAVEVAAGRLRATTVFDELGSCDVVSICVPTPVDADHNPDISFIEFVLEHGKGGWHAGQLVMLESTTYPGTTDEVLVPFFHALGLESGRDINVAFAPERIDPGSTTHSLTSVARVVGGATPQCTERAATFLESVIDAPIHRVSTARVAELTKLLENVFRVVNISLMNELAQMSDRMGIDLWEAIDAASTKPYGYMPFYPGPGVGGHCIPVDPFYLSWKARESGFDTRFIGLAGEINEAMPDYVCEQASEILGGAGVSIAGARVLLLGLAFKRNVADVRESASVKLALRLLSAGAEVTYHDPFVASVRMGESMRQSAPLTAEALRAADLVIVATDHDGVDYDLVLRESRLVYDTRNAIAGSAPHLHRLGAPQR